MDARMPICEIKVDPSLLHRVSEIRRLEVSIPAEAFASWSTQVILQRTKIDDAAIREGPRIPICGVKFRSQSTVNGPFSLLPAAVTTCHRNSPPRTVSIAA